MATTSAKTTKTTRRSIADIARETAATRKPRSPKTPVGYAVEQKYLDRKQAGAYIGVSAQFIIQLVKDGLLPEYDFGPFVKRYLLSDLEAFCLSRRKGPESVASVLA